VSFPNVVQGSEGDLWHNSATEDVPVGTLMVVEDGRWFRFAELFTTASVVGSTYQAEVHLADQSGEAIATLAAGVYQLTGVGSTTSAVVKDELVNGYIYTDNASTLPMMRIKNNSAIAAAGTGTVDLWTVTPTAIAAANTVSYFKNPWRDIIVTPAGETAPVVGVPKVAITANQFGWVQTTGPASCLYDTTTTAIAGIGDPIGPSADVAGAIAGVPNGEPDTMMILGSALGLVEGDTEQTPVWLRLE
jgi:hypothetical protein